MNILNPLKSRLHYLLAAVLFLAACGGEDPVPAPPPPPAPPEPAAKKERTIPGRSIDDYKLALTMAKAHADSTYFLQLQNDWEIDSVALHLLQEYNTEKSKISNLTVYRGLTGIYAPDEMTQYLYDDWVKPGWDIRENPENGATPFADLKDYPKFVAAKQTVVREIESETSVINLTADMARRFSAVVDSVLLATPENSKIDWRQNGHPVIMDDRTLGLINRADSRIKIGETLKIREMYLTTGQYAIGDTLLCTDMYVRKSTAVGVHPQMRLYDIPPNDFYVQIVAAYKRENHVWQDKSYWVEDQWFLEPMPFILIELDALPFHYPPQHEYERVDGSKGMIRGYYGISAHDYAIVLDSANEYLVLPDRPDETCGNISRYSVERQIAITDIWNSSQWIQFYTPHMMNTHHHLSDKVPISRYRP